MMKNEAQLNGDILKVTMLIREKYPELMEYISEMPVTIPNVPSPEINIKVLQEYYNSLVAMIDKYGQNGASFITS